MREGTLSDAIFETSTMDIVEFFDVPYKTKNGKTYLLCPGHDDKHFGSCYIDKNDNGYYCYACGEHVKKWQMVLLLNGNRKNEAAQFFFQMAGMTPVKENKEDPFRKVVKLIRELEKYINNDVVYNDVQVCDKINSSYGRNINGEYLYSELAVSNPLIEVYKSSKATFKNVVAEMLDKEIKKVSKLMHSYETSDDGIFIEDVGLLLYKEMTGACQVMIDEMESLMEEVNNL